MKKLLYNIPALMLLTLLSLGILSCSDDLQEVNNGVEVNFTATLPTDPQTRSLGDGSKVNTLVVGVFNEDEEEIDRTFVSMNGSTANVQLTLAQDQTYHFIFWAYYYDDNLNIYNISDLTAITMNNEFTSFAEAEAADAFFATKRDVAVKGDSHYSVELVRPLAQINVGTTGKVMQAKCTVYSVPDTFYPFSNTVGRTTTDYTWSFSETTDETFWVEGVEYNYLAMGYLFAPSSSSTQVAVDLTLTDNAGNSETCCFSEVELRANYRSNIAGRFTGE